MGFPRYFSDISSGLLLDFYGVLLAFLWDSFGVSKGCLWDSYGIPVELP